MEDFLSNKNSPEAIIGQSPVGNIVNLAYKICRLNFTQGAKVAGLSACPDFVTNGEHAHSPFTKNVPNWLIIDYKLYVRNNGYINIHYF